jgi:preprotein translocase subunit YajC
MLGKVEPLAASSSSSGFNPSTLILILIVVVAFYLLMIRPQQRRRQQAAQKQDTVTPGARVRTTAGMYATVVAVDGDDVILEVAPGVEVRYMRRSVMDVVSPGETVEEDEATDEVEETDDFEETDEATTDVDDDVETEGHHVEDTTDTPQPAAGDAKDTAYEQATGTKKD